MATYLLLRDNKESGPYSLEDLMSMGLKAYDLVWVQGKSAAWRYPSELEELKAFAPAVEEQPFDRFFKKQVETKKEEKPVSVIAPEHEKYIPKKSVFVTMPGQKTASPQPVKKQEPVPTPTPEPVQQTIIISENPAAAQIKYSQPLDEIKEMYVKTLHDRKQKIARKGFLLQAMKKAAVVLLFIAIGLIAGFIIKSGGSKQSEIAQKTSASAALALPKTEAAPILAAEDSGTNVISQDQQTLHQPTGGYINKEPQRQEQSSVIKKEDIEEPLLSNVKSEKKPVTSPSQTQPATNNTLVSEGVDINPQAGERNRKIRSENNGSNNKVHHNNEADELKASSSLGELSGLVTVSSNEYKKVAFGGIRNLQLTVSNESKYVLDQVIVELQYIRPNELPLRTENIYFKSVAPKASATVSVPDTNRGIKVVYRIINIKSRQMDEVATGN